MTRKPQKPENNAKTAAKAKPADALKRTPPKNPSKRAQNRSAMEIMGIEELCDRLRSGETLTSIANSLRLKSISTLLKWIAADEERSARAREARIAGSAMYDEMAQAAIENAADPLALAKARELAQHFRWRASKLDPWNYGDKVQLGGTINHKGVSDDQLLARLNSLGVAVQEIIPKSENGA